MDHDVTEEITIEIDLSAEFWDQLPRADLLVDDTLISSHAIDQKIYTIKDTVKLEMDRTHRLQLARHGKTDSQCCVIDGVQKDQYIIIRRVVIDGVDVQNLLWSRSWYEPEYPLDWAAQQESAGIELETRVLGETWLSHNGVWHFNFFSPFYRFVISQFRE